MSRFAALQALVADIAVLPGAPPLRLALGEPDIDARVGGLALAAVHELLAASEDDMAAVAGFALLLALRTDRPGPIVWVRDDRTRHEGRLYGLGLADLGCDPDRLLLVEAPDALAVLRAGHEAVQCPAVAAVLLEPASKAAAFDLNATRRLALAAARSGVPTLLLRSGPPAPSAAASRWAIRAAPSRALPALAPGAPAFAIELLRHRGGVAGFTALLEWNRDRNCFETPLPGIAPAVAGERAGVAARRLGTTRRAA